MTTPWLGDPVREWTREEVHALFEREPIMRQLTGPELFLLRHTSKVYARDGAEPMRRWGILGSGYYDYELRCPAHEYPLRYWHRVGKLECPALSCPYTRVHPCEWDGVRCTCSYVHVPHFFWLKSRPR